MNSTEPSRSDVLAHKRESDKQPEAISLADSYLAKSLADQSGRAFLWSLLNDVGAWKPEVASDRATWGREWHAALIDLDPLAVGSMWSEAMSRLFAKRTGITQ